MAALNFDDLSIKQAIAEILAELRTDPRFTIEDEAAAIHAKVFEPYQKFLFLNFCISAEAYERKHC